MHRQPGRLPKELGLVRSLPGEVVVVAAEVAVGRGLRVDRSPQVEVAQDRSRPEVEVLDDEVRMRATGITSVPKHWIWIENGCAIPIAYATWSSHRSARPAATTFFAT